MAFINARDNHSAAMSNIVRPNPVADRKEKLKAFESEKGIYLVKAKGLFRVKVAGNWCGYFYTLNGAREERDKQTLQMEMAKAERKMASLKAKHAAIELKHQMVIFGIQERQREHMGHTT